MEDQMAQTQTLRETARRAVIGEVPEAARRQHLGHYHKLHVRRDGSIHWFVAPYQSSDIIDNQADHFCAVKSVYSTGCGSCACNCDYCDAVYDGDDEARAIEDGRKYDRAAKYETEDEAIADSVGDSDLGDLEDTMVAALDAIEIGYFEDEDLAYLVEAATAFVEATKHADAQPAWEKFCAALRRAKGEL
jgi:hypothetical protein